MFVFLNVLQYLAVVPDGRRQRRVAPLSVPSFILLFHFPLWQGMLLVGCEHGGRPERRPRRIHLLRRVHLRGVTDRRITVERQKMRCTVHAVDGMHAHISCTEQYISSTSESRSSRAASAGLTIVASSSGNTGTGTWISMEVLCPVAVTFCWHMSAYCWYSV